MIYVHLAEDEISSLGYQNFEMTHKQENTGITVEVEGMGSYLATTQKCLNARFACLFDVLSHTEVVIGSHNIVRGKRAGQSTGNPQQR